MVTVLEHRAADLGLFVLEREIPVPRPRSGKIRNFTLNKEKRKFDSSNRFACLLSSETDMIRRLDSFIGVYRVIAESAYTGTKRNDRSTRILTMVV